jgi:hypothetical protein
MINTKIESFMSKNSGCSARDLAINSHKPSISSLSSEKKHKEHKTDDENMEQMQKKKKPRHVVEKH